MPTKAQIEKRRWWIGTSLAVASLAVAVWQCSNPPPAPSGPEMTPASAAATDADKPEPLLKKIPFQSPVTMPSGHWARLEPLSPEKGLSATARASLITQTAILFQQKVVGPDKVQGFMSIDTDDCTDWNSPIWSEGVEKYRSQFEELSDEDLIALNRQLNTMPSPAREDVKQKNDCLDRMMDVLTTLQGRDIDK
ncbi:hypothetical protein [Novosphingobium sp. JCM 18896]|uniref:hypothetical protein n=1 Tax=Novosphingobium sp. JCM 18896 TaxID=2989731 RepID=UPI002222F523|nr:hypothetical protein [Novosphingobium sp. JCM 18896]MCW1432018.1 hypothetical protein [Novosphingobium sp. JCM 18896]